MPQHHHIPQVESYLDDLTTLAELIKKRNSIAHEITALINRPAGMGHIGEYIVSRIFQITLEESAARKSIDGRFSDGPLKDCTVNIKWYAQLEGVLDITTDPSLDYYLVLTGPKSPAMTSRGQVRPWIIESVFLFDAFELTARLQVSGLRIGISTSVRRQLWEEAEIYPVQRCIKLIVSDEQRRLLALFKADVVGG